MLARAIAKETGFRFLVVQPNVVNNKYIGESEKIIQAIFQLAKRLSPCVLFVDEIEVLLGNRDVISTSNTDFKQIKIAEFLTAWDGFEKIKKPVVVIGATNKIEQLDRAILRRMPIQIEIPLPSAEAREAMFQHEILNRDNIQIQADWKQYIKKTENWDCSKIKNFIQFILTSAVQETVNAMPLHEPELNPIEKCSEPDLSESE